MEYARRHPFCQRINIAYVRTDRKRVFFGLWAAQAFTVRAESLSIKEMTHWADLLFKYQENHIRLASLLIDA